MAPFGTRAIRCADMEWVKCSERLPRDHETVLVHGGIAKLIKGHWYTGMEEPIFFNRIEWDVTHWMPLPEPPKPEEK